MKNFKPPASSPFAILPWEHEGAAFDPAPGATVRVEIGGKRRGFLLKMRGGRIYFKEPSRAQTYVTLDQFEKDLSGDALVEKWEHEIEAERYGALVTRRDYFLLLPVRAQMIFLVRPDGSALVQEHFDGQTWFDLPRAPVAPSLWDTDSLQKAMESLASAAQETLINRVMIPQQRTCEPTHFVGCTEAEYASIARGAFALFVPDADGSRGQWFAIEFHGHSSFQRGQHARFGDELQQSSGFARVWALMLRHRKFVGVDWRRVEEEKLLQHSQQAERFWHAGIEKWGEDWRGNWAPQRGHFGLQLVLSPSAHDQMEGRLALRDFLASLDSDEAADLRGKL